MACTVNNLMKFLLFLVQLIYTIVYYGEAADGNKTSWIRSGYWLTVSTNPALDIVGSLFTHLYCGFAGINSTTYQLSIPTSDVQYFASFTSTVKQNNPSIQTLLSIGDHSITPTFLSMISNSSSRKSFINSSIQTALTYGFNGLDICCFLPNTTSDSLNMAKLFNEWRSAVDHSDKRLILSMGIHYLPTTSTFDHDQKDGTVVVDFPVDAIQRNFDWVHMMSFDYFVPQKYKFAHPHAALYDPYNPHACTEYGLNQWISKGLPANKILIGMPYHGWVWTLLNPKDNQIGAPASGPGINPDGSLAYRWIKRFVKSYATKIVYNSTYVENTCSFGSFWVGFNDVDAIKTKVSYAQKKGLRGYNVFQVGNDDNWVLSKAAAEITGGNQHNKRLLLVKVLVPAASICCLSLIFYFLRARMLKYGRSITTDTRTFSYDSPDVKAFGFKDINEATDNFSFYKKLGEGGYGPVYKGKLKTGQEIAVKRLSKASKQGFQQFKNEVMLTARLQHVNLVKVMGFCVEREEKMLIYEYLPNSSLDFYLFGIAVVRLSSMMIANLANHVKSLQLDWGKRAHIIEGIIQGLLYLQEYSRLTIIHRDLKASNILLDKDLNPKISDFGMARIFQTDENEANTSNIVGTYGYVPPEYVKQGVYSRKHDVYSFGVLLLQIISGKRNNQFYGANAEYNLLEYAYELWKEDEGKEFVDPSLDDSNSKYKLMRCMQVALLCVQEKQEDRPSMLEISAILNNKIEHIINPKRPAFSTKPDAEPSQQLPCSQHLNYSNTDSVLSKLEPR